MFHFILILLEYAKMREKALKEIHSKIRQDENGKTVLDAKDILSLPWQEYRALVTTGRPPEVDHVHVEPGSPYSPLYWLAKDLDLKQTISLWSACSTCLIVYSATNPDNASAALIGLMSWIPIEYGFHSFLGHMPVVNDFTKTANFYLHNKHHFAPNDVDRGFIPPAVVMIMAMIMYRSVYCYITNNPEMALGCLMFHYLAYELMHYSMHRYHLKEVLDVPIVGSTLARIWGNHARHHAESDKNFLVTTGGLMKGFFSPKTSYSLSNHSTTSTSQLEDSVELK
jgi:hypothetical protein